MYGINNVFKYSVPSYNFYREIFPVDDGLGVKYYNMSSYSANGLQPLYTARVPSYPEFALLRYADVGEYTKTLNISDQYMLSSLICPYISRIMAGNCYYLESLDLYNVSSFYTQDLYNCSRLHDVTLRYSSVVNIEFYTGNGTPLFYSKYTYYSGPCHLYVPDSLYDAYVESYYDTWGNVGYFIHSKITRLSERPY